MAYHNPDKKREHWGSKIGFVLAAAGSAVGLGNLWKFPYVAGRNGGGAFVIVYLAILFLLGFSLILAEIVVGRHAQLDVVGSYRKISKNWAWVGGMGVITGFLILSFYSVIGGWVVNYLFKAGMNAFQGADPQALDAMFGGFVSNTYQPLIFHGIFMFLTLLIVIGGIGGGIEKASKIMMPALFIMIIAIAIRAVTLEGAMEGVRYLFVPDFSQLNIKVVLDALGQVFFSLSLGMGAMITYGSYLSKDTDIPRTSVAIPILDTAVALLAGLATLPAVFAFGFEPAGGPGLMFVTLPAVFSQVPLGQVFAIIFFLLVLFAALTSSISLLEVCVSYTVDEWGWTRGKSTVFISLLIFLIGVTVSLSFGPWAEIEILPGRNIFGTLDFVTSNVMLPLGGLLLSIFVGWVWGIDRALDEITNNRTITFPLGSLWAFLIKYVMPLAIGIVFVRSII